MWKDTDAEILHGYDIGTRGCGSGCRGLGIEVGLERGIVIGDNDATGESAADEEDSEAEVNRLECSLEVLAWVWELWLVDCIDGY